MEAWVASCPGEGIGPGGEGVRNTAQMGQNDALPGAPLRQALWVPPPTTILPSPLCPRGRPSSSPHLNSLPPREILPSSGKDAGSSCPHVQGGQVGEGCPNPALHPCSPTPPHFLLPLSDPGPAFGPRLFKLLKGFVPRVLVLYPVPRNSNPWYADFITLTE